MPRVKKRPAAATVLEEKCPEEVGQCQGQDVLFKFAMLNFFCLVIVKYFELVTCNLYLAFLWGHSAVGPCGCQPRHFPGTSAASQKKVSMAKAKAKASQEANAKPETQKAVSKRMKKEEHAAVEAVPPQEAEADADTVRFCEDLVSMCEDFGDKPCKEGSLPRQNAQDFPSDPDSADCGCRFVLSDALW